MLSRPTPKKMILGLLLAWGGKPLSVRDAIRACALFDLTENNTRVTLVRLSSEGLIQGVERGQYVLGPRAEGMAADVGRWREAPGRLRPWNGDWMMVLTGTRDQRGRQAKQQQLRALDLCGLRPLDAGLYLRPANLAGDVPLLRERLDALGAPCGTLVAHLSNLDGARDKAARALWDGEALQKAYKQTTERLNTWLGRYHSLDLEEAARESYLLGNDAIRQLVYDPWLPEGLVDVESRQRLFEAVCAVDDAGKSVWAQLFDQEAAMPIGTANFASRESFAS